MDIEEQAYNEQKSEIENHYQEQQDYNQYDRDFN